MKFEQGKALKDKMDKSGKGPRIYYGWILVLTIAIAQTTSWGILSYAFTVFLGPMEAELGWSRGELTAAFPLALLVAAVAGMGVGRWWYSDNSASLGTRKLKATASNGKLDVKP